MLSVVGRLRPMRRLAACARREADTDRRRSSDRSTARGRRHSAITVCPLRDDLARRRTTPNSRSLRGRVRRAAHRLRQRHESHARPRAESPPGVGRANGDGRAARRDRTAVARRERGHCARVRPGRSRPRRRRDSRAVEPAAVVDCPSRPRRSRRAGARLHADRERGGDTRLRHGAGIRCGP